LPLIQVSPWLRPILFSMWISASSFASDAHTMRLEQLQTPNDSMPDDRVTCMLRDRYGFLWMGTQRGLIRNHFTGFRWYRPDPNDPKSLVSGDIQVLLEDRADRFWVGTNSGLHRLDRRSGYFLRIEPILANGDPWPSVNIRILVEDQNGKLWIGTDQGLLVWKNGTVETIDLDLEFEQGWVSGVVLGSGGRIWAVTREQGIYLLGGDEEEAATWRRVAENWPKPILAVHRTRNGMWYLGTESGLFRSADDPETENLDIESLTKEPVQSLEEDPRGAIWVGQLQGLKRVDADGVIRDVKVGSDGEAPGIQSITADDLGMVWMSIASGGVHFWNSYREHWWARELDNAETWALESDGGGGVWVGTKYQGLLHVLPGRDEMTRLLDDKVVRGLHKDNRGNLWIGTESGLFRMAPGETRPASFGSPFDQRVWRMVRDRHDRLWLGMDSGLWVTQADRPETRERPAWLEPFPGLTQAVITAIAINGDRLWVGTYSHGLFKLDLADQKVQAFNRESETALPSNEIVDVFIDRAGFVWICSVSGGLACLSPAGELLGPDVVDKYHDEAVVALLQDRAGGYWANSGSGLILFEKEKGTQAIFNEKDGVLLQSVIPGVKLITDAGVWFGGTEGIIRLSPQKLPLPDQPPIAIASVRIDGREVTQLLLPGESLDIGENVGSFTLEMAQMDPLWKELDGWSYRRVSKNETWIDLESNVLQLGRYLPLGGRDQIQVKAIDHLGRQTQFQFQINFLPPWWRAWLPFWSIAAVLFIMLVTYLLVSRAERRRRARLVKEAQDAIARQKLAEDRAAVAERERELESKAKKQQQTHMKVLQQHMEKVSTEMANDLHDGPLSELRGLRFQLSHLQKGMTDPGANTRLRDLTETLLPRMSQNLRKVCGELLLPSFEFGLVPELEKYVDNLKAQSPELDIRTRWDFDETLWSNKNKGTLFRIFRTLVKNVEDHARASHLKIELVGREGETRLEVIDDGVGFSVEERYDALRENKHFGLYMAYFFARGLGGELRITGNAGKGTSAVFQLKAKENRREGEEG